MPALLSSPVNLSTALPLGAGPSAALASASGGVVILMLCVAAGIGTILMLPGRREACFRRIGGAIVLAIGLIAMALIARLAADKSSGEVYFWIFSVIAVVSALRVITHPKPVYSALYFVLTVMASAGLFVLLWAEFMAAALVLVYAGAILVTYVFVIMLASQAHAGKTGEVGAADYDLLSREPLAATAVGFALMGVLMFVILDKAGGLPAGVQTPLSAEFGGPRSIGEYLFNNQYFNMELAGLILTIGMVGAIVIARKRIPVDPMATVAKSAVINDDPHSIPVYGTDNPRTKAFPES